MVVKVVPDDQETSPSHPTAPSTTPVHQIVSEYDLNAIEAATLLLAEEVGARATLYAVSASNAGRRPQGEEEHPVARTAELRTIADDAFAFARTPHHGARPALARGGGIGEVGLALVCGDGSADMYAGQVDVQLAAELHLRRLSTPSRPSSWKTGRWWWSA